MIKSKNNGLNENEIDKLEEISLKYAGKKNEIDNANHETIASIRGILSKYGQYGSLHLGGVPTVSYTHLTLPTNREV